MENEVILNWTEPAPPGADEIPYDHVIAETIFGRIVISWKSWKDYPQYTLCEHPVNDWYTGNTLEDAKIHAADIYNAALCRAGSV